jgi:SAM-dependent methyltransferase
MQNLDDHSRPCPICRGRDYNHVDVLWDELIDTWEINSEETVYINRQQGFHCASCGSNLRSMALAQAMLNHYGKNCSLMDAKATFEGLNILEINEAGMLTRFLKEFQGHRLVSFPEYDMQNLDLADESWDLLLHSDTLEHVPDPVQALRECRRVLRTGGVCIYTVPMIVDRMNRSRVGLPNSYHGQSSTDANDLLVWSEFGADAWRTVIEAGFQSCEIFSYDFPAALVLIARKL